MKINGNSDVSRQIVNENLVIINQKMTNLVIIHVFSKLFNLLHA